MIHLRKVAQKHSLLLINTLCTPRTVHPPKKTKTSHLFHSLILTTRSLRSRRRKQKKGSLTPTEPNMRIIVTELCSLSTLTYSLPHHFRFSVPLIKPSTDISSGIEREIVAFLKIRHVFWRKWSLLKDNFFF